jgi:hypothetical protein
MNNLGVLYETGQGVSKNYAAARRWYEKAADTGYALAMDNLGLLYLYGRGVAKDSAEAKRWFLKGADLGNPEAMTDLGEIYHNGEGIARDYAEAEGRQARTGPCHVQHGQDVRAGPRRRQEQGRRAQLVPKGGRSGTSGSQPQIAEPQVACRRSGAPRDTDADWSPTEAARARAFFPH